MKHFSFDDSGYLRWVQANPNGFVLNAGSVTDHTTKLHRATCKTIRGTPPRAGGRFHGREEAWTGSRWKVCSLDKYELLRWAPKNHRGKDASLCLVCNP